MWTRSPQPPSTQSLSYPPQESSPKEGHPVKPNIKSYVLMIIKGPCVIPIHSHLFSSQETVVLMLPLLRHLPTAQQKQSSALA